MYHHNLGSELNVFQILLRLYGSLNKEVQLQGASMWNLNVEICQLDWRHACIMHHGTSGRFISTSLFVETEG